MKWEKRDGPPSFMPGIPSIDYPMPPPVGIVGMGRKLSSAQDGEPVVFPRASHEKPPDGISIVARLKSGEYIEGDVASGFFIVYGRAPTPVTEIVWWAKRYRAHEETSPPTGDALARGTAVHEHMARLLTVVEKARGVLTECSDVDRHDGRGPFCRTHGEYQHKCPHVHLREALANLDAHDEGEVSE